MEDEMNVLFVCTGNIFRSLSAEYCLKDYLQKNRIRGINVSSAGTIARKAEFDPTLLNTFQKLGIDITGHKQRRLNEKIIKKNDFIIAMAKSHQHHIQKNYDLSVPLYNKIAINKNTSVKDLNEVIPPITIQDRPRWDSHIKRTIHLIHKKTPKLEKNIKY